MVMMMKIDLRDVTFTIPFLFDSDDRIRNLQICLGYLNKYLESNIIIIEQNGEKAKCVEGDFQHIRVDSEFDEIHRSRLLNAGAANAQTEILVNYDCDVLFFPDQYEKAANWIRENTFEMVYPYNGRFLILTYEWVGKIEESLDLSIIDQKLQDVGAATGSLGGSMFYNKSKFVEYGMENENLYGWAYDDNERHCRFKKLGMKMGRTDKPLYHLHHVPTGKNFGTPSSLSNNRELKRIQKMSKSDLMEEVKLWLKQRNYGL